MAEGYNQSKIIKWFHALGGTAITGRFPAGEADIQAGYPHRGRLLNVMIETKTPEDYYRVMRAIEEVDERYVIVDRAKLKKHEPLQITKINLVREKGGMALIACEIAQVKEYIEKELLKC